jgi:hypothetical protein
LLLYWPVTTCCGHRFCESYMAHWVDVSFTSALTIVPVVAEPREYEDEDDVWPNGEIGGDEAQCPTCRTWTLAELNGARAEALSARISPAVGEKTDRGAVRGVRRRGREHRQDYAVHRKYAQTEAVRGSEPG